MDLATRDQRAWRLAPHLVLVSVTPEWVQWVNPQTGTAVQLGPGGEYAVLRQVAGKMAPVVAGQILPEEAAVVFEDPQSLLARRAAAHAIIAVDAR